MIRIVSLVLVALAVAAAPARAAIPQSLRDTCERLDAADGDVANGVAIPYWLCDDGVPEAGGRDPNVGGVGAVTVPAAYQGFEGLPAKAPDAATVPGADAAGDVALDVDVTLPDPGRHPPPAGGYPLLVFMHGCCSGDKTGWEARTIDAPESAERWHYSNAFFASQGYVVLTYTARGFVSGKGPTDLNGDGSTGETQIDHRSFEINDFQHLAGQLVDAPFSVAGTLMPIDPRRVVATGGSYGGGFAWLALTDPEWTSPAGTAMRLAAAAPRYGWSDLVYSLVPNGTHLEGELPPADPAAAPIGFPKRSIVAALYATGQEGATFPRFVDTSLVCLQAPLPIETNPQCADVREQVLPSFAFDRSAYYQNAFFERLAAGTLEPVPVFSAGTTTDPLFPGVEHRRMVARLERARPGYPVQEYYGDYQHFVQNKRKEWADLCGAADEVCELDRYAGRELSGDPAGLSRRGVTSRLVRFIDHYARPSGNADEPRPRFDVTAALQICPQNASEAFPLDQAGRRFTAPSFGELAPNTLAIEVHGEQRTTDQAEPNLHAALADPLANLVTREGRCPLGTGPAGPGVASYDSVELPRAFTMIGPARLAVPYEGSGSELQLNARMYDVFPDGTAVLVDRGFRTLTDAEGVARIDLLGNGWRFERGHRIRFEIAQDDDPYIKASTVPSSLELAGVAAELPVRERSAALHEAVPERRRRPRRDRAGGGRGDGEGADAGDPGRGAPEAVPASTGSLPFSGFALLPPLATGAALLLAGAGLRGVTRRRYRG